ncbi:MAG: hypothetical protein SNG27_07390, partial [Rikenellaceae bacterium]
TPPKNSWFIYFSGYRYGPFFNYLLAPFWIIIYTIEKSIDEVGKLVATFDVAQGDFSSLEEQITYFGMLTSLRPENYEKVGLGDEVKYLTDKNRFEIVQSLTDEKKCIIKRDFILSKLRTAYRGNYTAVMLNEYAKQHDNEQYEKIT